MPPEKYEPDDLLNLVFERLARDRPTEIRFVTGMAPAFACAAGPRFFKVAYLTTEAVQALHKLCLTWAEQSGILASTSARYRVNVPGVGRFRCDYHHRDNTASLTLRPDLSSLPAPQASRPARRKPG